MSQNITHIDTASSRRAFMSPKYWEYFKTIEADLESTGRYVDFDRSNYETFSNEFARILMAAGSEIDNVMKELCKKIDSSKTPDKITEYYPIVTGHYARFRDMKLNLPRFGLTVKPWTDWTEQSRPYWWKDAFNKIKHQRDQHFATANLKNCIDAVAGLLVAIVYYYDAADGQMPLIDIRFGPSLFSIEEETNGFKEGGVFWTPTILK